MKALILAGGLGTRLRTIAQDVPKPMVPVHGKPFLEHQLEQLKAQGFEDLVFCVSYLAEHIREHFGNGDRWGVQIAYATENQLLGTAGAIKNAHRYIEDAFLVLNGDSFLEIDFLTMVRSHRCRQQADSRVIGTVAVVATEDATSYGALELAADGRILAFREKQVDGPGWINSGAYVLEPTVLATIPTGRATSIERDIFPTIVELGYHLFSHPLQGFFVDIGTPEGYRRFCQYTEERLR
jgi:NDP-sugar pyrophosphorylase family protein